MDKIEHRIVSTNGINLHVAEIGSGPPVLLLHGFPELWYSWRHQMVSLASSGYRAIAPDLRGYGDSDSPPSVDSYTVHHIVGDLVGLLSALKVDQPVFLVGHDWGAIVAWIFTLFRPDLIKALVNISVPFVPRDPSIKPVTALRDIFGDQFYICTFQEAGATEELFAKVPTDKFIKSILLSRNPKPPRFTKDRIQALLDAPNQTQMPSWLTEEDVQYFAGKFDKSGFTGGLNYYRAIDKSWELFAPWGGAKVKVPTKFIVGDLDLTYNMPGAKEYINGDGFKEHVPYMQEVIVLEDAGHFVNQEKHQEITAHILDFIAKF
ncbi:epoxide hydrolase A-like [Impatiens glandulifera]|uniref:epoxide hydrolase A-like n=1 Tax=Impatiens glandulifera TaxID=253017 RepID=UPI001FB0D777|nr:epoxide hydrolase A-like [Impatiens glandulifera]